MWELTPLLGSENNLHRQTFLPFCTKKNGSSGVRLVKNRHICVVVIYSWERTILQDITMNRKRSSENEVRVESSVTDDLSQEDEDYDPNEYCKIRVNMTTCVEVEVDRDSTIEEIKKKFEELSRTPLEERFLIHNARRLDPKKTLANYGIKDNDSIWLTNNLK